MQRGSAISCREHYVSKPFRISQKVTGRGTSISSFCASEAPLFVRRDRCLVARNLVNGKPLLTDSSSNFTQIRFGNWHDTICELIGNTKLTPFSSHVFLFYKSLLCELLFRSRIRRVDSCKRTSQKTGKQDQRTQIVSLFSRSAST